METTYPGGIQIIRGAFLKEGIPSKTIDIMISSLSSSSIKQYNCTLKKWWQYCVTHEIDCYYNDIRTVLDFLTLQYEAGANYPTLNTHRSALSLILGKRVGNDERIGRFIKGVFRIKPCLPRYQST
jgi:hypothetical protein